MQYATPDIPDELDRAIRVRAAAEQKSLEDAIVDALARGLCVEPQSPVKRRDLSDIAGTWVVDPDTEAVLDEQGRVDPEIWR